MYLVLSSPDGLYLVDQHALAERIRYEQLKAAFDLGNISSAPLLQGISYPLPPETPQDLLIDKLETMGFALSLITERSLTISQVPQPLIDFQLDIASLLDRVISANLSDVSVSNPFHILLQ